MAIVNNYVIGDVQGCFRGLERLLDEINYQPQQDKLWFTGDLVNRGPDSLATLRWLAALDPPANIVLGNHDLHCLACYYQAAELQRGDTLQALLQAPDAEQLCAWLRRQPLLYYDETLNYIMVHAGLAASWSLSKAQALAKEVEVLLQGPDYLTLLKNMYGNQPAMWSEALQGWDRIRVILNYFTRVRFCYRNGQLALGEKGAPPAQDPRLLPWYSVPKRATTETPIVFGHWAALDGQTNTIHVHALDTGYVWGGALTAMRLEDRRLFQVKARPT